VNSGVTFLVSYWYVSNETNRCTICYPYSADMSPDLVVQILPACQYSDYLSSVCGIVSARCCYTQVLKVLSCCRLVTCVQGDHLTGKRGKSCGIWKRSGKMGKSGRMCSWLSYDGSAWTETMISPEQNVYIIVAVGNDVFLLVMLWGL